MTPPRTSASASGGAAAEFAERLKRSGQLYVRSQDHIAEYRDGASGRVLRAWEALDAFGPQVLAEVAEYGSAVLVEEPQEPAYTIRKRRKSLGLTISDLAAKTKLSVSEVEAAEDYRRRNPIRSLERIATALGLDERLLSFRAGSGGDDALAFRLRTLESGGASSDVRRLVGGLAEAAWVVRTQLRLERWLSSQRRSAAFEVSGVYGSRDVPAWKVGFNLARRARELLGIAPEEPIVALRELCVKLGVPVVQTALPHAFAGATVCADGGRGIVVNIVGPNSNVWVRRSTVAHELGHLLWDPEQSLKRLTVDKYALTELDSASVATHVEARANAFAIEFLAPQSAVRAIFPRTGGSLELRRVMETFGISLTAARHHVNNAWDRTLRVGQLGVSDSEPTADWIGRESFTVDWFPIDSTPMSRRGRFAGVVVAAERANLISRDTAAFYLCSSAAEYTKAENIIGELFPLEVR